MKPSFVGELVNHSSRFHVNASMYTYQKQELTNLRDAFRRNRSQLELPKIKDFIIDNIYDRPLLKIMNTDVARKAIWYCLCNNNADRDALISKLYDYFIKKGLDDSSALKLISIVLFLGGVDFQLNKIARPEHLVQSSSTLISSSGSNQNFKWIVGLALVMVVILVVLLLPKTCSDKGGAGGANSPYSMKDICIKYYGFIEEGNNKKTCELIISEDFEVTVSNKDGIRKYTAKLDGDKLKLNIGIPLHISKDNKGRIKLYYREKHQRWDFISK